MTSAWALGTAKTTIRPNPVPAVPPSAPPLAPTGPAAPSALNAPISQSACTMPLEKPQRPWTRYPPAAGDPVPRGASWPAITGSPRPPGPAAASGSAAAPKIRRAPASGSHPPASPLQPAPIMAAHAVEVSM